MKRAMFLAAVALLAMLILVPMTMAQQADNDTTFKERSAARTPGTNCCYVGGGWGATVMETTMVNGSPAPIPQSGGPAIVLPAAALLLGSGILTYAILRRR